MYDHEAQHALNQKHLENPKRGDYWEDHLVGVLQVVDVLYGKVLVLRKKIETETHWGWDTTKTELMSLPEFKKYLQYGSESMNGKTWASVHPERELIF